MANMNRTFDVTIRRAGIGVKRDGLVFDATSDGALKVDEYVDEGALSITAQSAVTIYLPTLDPAFAGSGYTWIAPTAMVEPEGFNRQGWDNRGIGGTPNASGGPSGTYDADLARAFPLTITPTPGQPQAVLLYRGKDTPEVGGNEGGGGAIVVVMVCYEAPSETAITPPWVYCPNGKPQITTADIDYNAFTPVAIPGGATEPDWSTMYGYHRRAYIQSGAFSFSLIAGCNPEYTQDVYPADQSQITGALLLGAVSESASRNTLINRIVRDGQCIDQIARHHDPYCWIAGAGFGQGAKAVRWFAGLFLGDAEMMARRPTLYNAYTLSYQDVFSEDGSAYLSQPSAEYPSPRWIYGHTENSTGWPDCAFGYNNDLRDPTGQREPHWVASQTGTVVSATSTTVVIDPAHSIPTGSNQMIWVDNGGDGEAQLIASFDAGTDTITLQGTWSVTPTAGQTYELCWASNNYQPIATTAFLPNAMAVALTGRADEFDTPGGAFWGYLERWLTEGANKPEPRYIWDRGNDNDFTYGDVNSGLWAKQFAASAVAMFPTINTTVSLELPVVAGSEMVAAVLTSATTANVTVHTRTDAGNLYWVATRSIVKPTPTQVQAGQDHTGASALASGSPTVSGTGAQVVAVAVDTTNRYIHLMHKSGADETQVETSRPLIGTQWGLSYSNTFDTDTSADWVSYVDHLDVDTPSVITYDGANDRLTVQIKSDWSGAQLKIPFQFERHLSYTFTINATNTSAATLDFQLGTRPQKRDADERNSRNNIVSGSTGQVGAGQTANMAHTITAYGDEFYLIVKLRVGSVDDVFHINSITVAQV